MRAWQLTLGIIFLFIFAAAAGISHAYKTFLKTPLIPADRPAITYILPQGASIRVLAADLEARNLIKHSTFLIALAYLKNNQKQLKAGEYLLMPGSTPGQFLEQIVAGRVVQYHFTIVEGWTFTQLLSALNNEPLITHTLNDRAIEAVITKLNLPANHPEGWFFPATYNFLRGATDISILEKAHRLMVAQLNQAWQERSVTAPYKTSYEALITASLIEKETAQLQERPLVAGVILKRLQLNMPLQIDSTIIYGLGSAYTGKLRSTDLKQDTIYNTYTRRGLPPTPIALPSKQSLQAAMHPAITDAIYFVAKNDGTHQFSNNLSAHNKAVTTYQIAITLPKVGKKAEKLKCPQPWYMSNQLYSLFSIDCQI